MASKKPVRNTSTKKTLKKKSAPKKKITTKKGTTKLSSKSATKKNKAKVPKASAKKKTSAKAIIRKKKTAAQKTSSKKKKSAPKKKVVKTASKPKAKKPVKLNQGIRKKKIAASKTKRQPTPTRKPLKNPRTPSAPRAQRIEKSKESQLSPTERYNIGGLFACAIGRDHDRDFSRLRAALHHLGIPAQEKDNLLRLSQGLMIPKLFAENLAEPKVNKLLAGLVKFAMKEGSYEHHWREEIQQIGFWLGIFPAQFQALEQQARR